MSDTALIFAGYRDEIERAANDKYDRPVGMTIYEIITVVAADFWPVRDDERSEIEATQAYPRSPCVPLQAQPSRHSSQPFPL